MSERSPQSEDCPFCARTDEHCVHTGPLVRAFADAYPVTPGHTLVVTRRHVASWFDATPDERAALFAAVDDVQAILARMHGPAGWNLGVNVGAAAGQTVPHLHLHVIARYDGRRW